MEFSPTDSLDQNQQPDRKIAGRSSGKRWLTVVVVVALLAAMAFLLSSRHEELTQFQGLSPTVLFAAVFFQFLSQLLWNGSMLLPLQTFMKQLGFWELFMVRTGGLLAGYVVPVAGNLAVRMTYLKRRGLTYSEFAWATLVSNVLALFSGGVLAVVGVGILWMIAGIPPVSILSLTASVLALGIAGLLVLRFLPRFRAHASLQKWLRVSGISGFQTSRQTLAWALTLLFMRHCLNFLTFGLLFQSLSRAPIDFVTGGLVYAITSPIRMIVLTPGNLGINEWVVAIVGKILSFDLTTGLIVALVFRGVSIAGQGLGALLGGTWLALWSTP